MLFLFNSQNGISQQRKDYKLSDYVAKKSKSEIGTLRSTQEEVFFPTFGDECTFDLVTVGIRNQWGRVSGMNGLGDREKAQLLTFEGSEAYRVVGAMVWFERPAIVGDGTLNCRIYTQNSENGRPDRLVGLSDALKVSEIIPPDTLSYPTFFNFENGAPITIDEPNFFLSCDFFNLYNTFDTVVMLQTIDGCGDGGNSWELFSDGETWTNIASAISWEINSDFIMSAVVDFEDPNSDQAFIKNEGLTLYPSFPNPSHDQITIPFSLEKGGALSIDVFDQSGRKIISVEHDFIAAGSQSETIIINNLSAGIYYYRLKSDQGQITSRFQIN